jgi:hypothetical protein
MGNENAVRRVLVSLISGARNWGRAVSATGQTSATLPFALERSARQNTMRSKPAIMYSSAPRYTASIQPPLREYAATTSSRHGRRLGATTCLMAMSATGQTSARPMSVTITSAVPNSVRSKAAIMQSSATRFTASIQPPVRGKYAANRGTWHGRRLGATTCRMAMIATGQISAKATACVRVKSANPN